MGLVKTRRRLAEDGSPHHAARPESAPYQAVRKCCQCGSVASSNVANFQFGAGYGARRIGLVYYSAKGKLSWRRNADITVRQAAGTAVHTARLAARVMTGVGV